MFPVGRFLARALVLGSRSPSRYYAEAAAAATGPAQLAFTFASPAQVLRPGVVTVFDEDGSSKKYFVSSGSLTVNADSSVQLLAEEVALLDELDAATAKSNLDKALSALASATDEVARAEAQINVEANEAIVKALE
ncbi:hypothetical protein Chor_017242 [Crotalus horridus]